MTLTCLEFWTLATLPTRPGSNFSGLLMAAGVFLMVFCTFSILKKRMKQRRAAPPHSRRMNGAHEQARADAQARRTVESTLVEAEELVRQLAAHLDNKAAKLEMLIREADQRLARLQEEGANSVAAERHTAPVADHDPYYESKLSDPTSRDVYRLADEGLAPIEIAQRLSEGVGKVELILALRNN